MNEGQLPTFDENAVILPTGKTLNLIVRAIIKEIIVDKAEFTISKDTPNKVTLSLAQGNEWRAVTDCDGNSFEVLIRNFVAAE